MKHLTNRRWPHLSIAVLAAALIVGAPSAIAQVPTDPPTAQQIEQQHFDLEQRLAWFDQRMAAYDERLRAMPVEQRTALQAEFDELRRERDQLRADVAALEGVPRAEWTQRYQPVRQRLMDLETRTWQFAQARGWLHEPTAAEVRHVRTDLEQRLQRLNQQLTGFEERIAEAPVEERAEMQRQLQEMRQERDMLIERRARLEAVPADRWALEFHPYHDRLVALEMRAHRFGATHGWVEVPTAAAMRQQRADLEQRLQRIDQELPQLEARVEVAPPDQRTALEAQLGELHRERDQLRSDIAALEGIPAEHWAVRFHPVETRLALVETRAQHFRPVAVARVEAAPPTAAEMREQRAELEHRLQQVERDFAAVEARVAAVPDEPMRADLEARLADLRQQRSRIQADIAALDGVPAAEWHVRFRPVGEAVARHEANFHRVRLTATPTRVQHVQLADQMLEMQRQHFDDLHRQLDLVPEEQRAEMAYEIIQLRSRYDELWRDHQRMRFAPVATYERIRVDFPEQVAQLETDIHMARLDMVAGVTVGG